MECVHSVLPFGDYKASYAKNPIYVVSGSIRQLKKCDIYFVQNVIMTIITHDIIAVCLTVIRNNSDISNKIFSVCENRSLKINWYITHWAGAKGTKEIAKYLNSVRLFRQ